MQRSFSIPNVSIALYLPLRRISTPTPYENTPMYAVYVRHCAVYARYGVYAVSVLPIAFGVSFYLNLPSQSPRSLFNGTW